VPALGKQMAGQSGHAPWLLPLDLIASKSLQHICCDQANHHLQVGVRVCQAVCAAALCMNQQQRCSWQGSH
jgi:hypothetical protein